MAQALPFMLQIFEQPHLTQQLNETGSMVDVDVLLKMIWEVSEWRGAESPIRKMTPQEEQKYQAAQQAGGVPMKTRGQMMVEQQRAGNKSKLLDQQTEANIAERLFEGTMDRAVAYDERVGDERTLAGSEFQPRM
jgi:hypothetical protein